MAIDGGSVEIRFEGKTEGLRRSVEEVVQNINEVEEAARDVDKNLSSSAFEGFGKKAKTEFSQFSDAVSEAFANAIDSSEGFGSILKEIGSSLKNIGFGVLTAGATAATASLTKMAKSAINETSALENIQIQMIGLTDSVEKGNKAMAMAVKYYKNNPFNRFDVTSATKNLIQFGAELKDIPDLLDKLGKVSLSTGASIDTLAFYYQRTIADGRIATRDLLQMQNQGVPIFGAIAKQMGITTGQVRELAAQGKVAIKDFQAAFDNLVSDEAMERFNNTLSRQLDRFKGRLSNLRASLAGYSTNQETGLLINENGLYRAVTRMYKTFADVMDSDVGKKLYEGFEKLGAALSKVINKFTDLIKPALNLASQFLNFIGDNSELLIPLLGGILVMFGRLGANLPVVGQFIQGINKNFSNLYANIKKLVTLHPALTAFFTILSVGFIELWKNDEGFRETITEIGKALKDIISVLAEAGKGVFTAFVDVIKELASQGVVTDILHGIASALKVVAQALASIPPEVVASLISFFLSLKLIKTSPLAYAITLISMFATYVEQMGGLPEALEAIGNNMMVGLVNGLKEGATKVFNFVKDVATTVVDTFKNLWGIHSPSTVGYDLGYNFGLGIAGGVKDSSDAVQVGMNNLAEDVLKTAEKVFSRKVSFGLLDYKGQYKEWKKISQLFNTGSEQYAYAIEKMEDARKDANLQILNLQKTYNDELDSTIDKISGMYGLFDDVNLGGGKNAGQILSGLDQQVAKMQEWAAAQEKINTLGLDPALVKELQGMGVESTTELSSIANMTADELATLNDFWLKKQEIANKVGVEQMKEFKEETLNEINSLKTGIDGATIDISDVGGRLVESIAEGVYGAMPTLENAMAQLDEYIAKAQKAIGGNARGKKEPEDDENDLISGVKQNIEASMEKLKNMLPNIMLGAIGAWGALKFGPKILGAIFNKIGGALLGGGSVSQGIAGNLFKSAELGEGLKSGLLRAIDGIPREEYTVTGKLLNKIQGWLTPKSDGNIEKAAEQVAKVAKPSQTIAKDVGQVSDGLSGASQSLSAAPKWMTTIQQGAKTITSIAISIAAIAGACWVAYNALKDVEWKKFNMALVDMAEAVGVFALLGKAVEKLGTGIKEILILAGVAGDIAAVAKACRFAYDEMQEMQWPIFGDVLGKMAAAVGEFALFAGILGLPGLAVIEAKGLLVIAGIAGDIALVAKACRTAYDEMSPMDFGTWGKMLEMMIDSLGKIGGFQALVGLLAPLEFLGWASIISICDSLKNVADALKKVYETVPDDLPKVAEKIDLIKQTLEYVHEKTDIIGAFIDSIDQKLNASIVESASRIVVAYGDTVDAINKIATFNPNKDAVNAGLKEVYLILEAVKESTQGHRGIFNLFSSVDSFAAETEKLVSIVQNYAKMVPTIDELGKDENQISDDLKTTVDKNISNIKAIVTTIGQVDTGGWVTTKEKDVKLIQSILNNFMEMVPTIQSVAKIDTSKFKTAKTRIEDIEKIVLAIGKVDTGGWIETKENDVRLIQSILNKFTELAQTTQLLDKYPIADNADEWIKDARNLVYQIGSVNQVEGIDNKVYIVEKSIEILGKIKEFVNSAEGLKKIDEDAVNTAVNAVTTVVQGLPSVFNDNIDTFKNLGVEIGTKIAEGLNSQTEYIGNVGGNIQSALWQVIESRKQDEYYQGRSLGETFRQGFYDIDYGNAGWWAVQGFIDGAWGRAGNYEGVYNTGWWIADRFLKGLKDRGEQGSPWKTTIESGKWAVEGLIDGIKSEEASLIGEATSLADQVVNALNLDGASISPTLDVSGNTNLVPSMATSQYGIVSGNGRDVVVEQNNYNYTQYDFEQSQRDLAWALSKV